ncbi:MAG: hypothetical protein AAB489_02060 [Patescibacteria group bacterium]
MENSSATPQEQNVESPQGIAELTEILFQAAPATLSVEVRSFLEKVLSLHESPTTAAAWLTSPIVALNGAVPADELRKGNAQNLQDFWNECEKRYGY